MDNEQAHFELRYIEATGLVAGDKRREAALARAHALRQFEIDNYWKRSTYFWAFQAIAFGGLAWIFSEQGEPNPQLLMPVCLLGGLTALAGCLTARGSKFWQENWEAHVDMLEDELEGALHKTVMGKTGLGKNGRSFSVSIVNQKLLDIFCSAWAICFMLAFARTGSADYWTISMLDERLMVILSLVFAMVAVIYLSVGSKSRLPGAESRHPYEAFGSVPSSQSKNKLFLIRRLRDNF